MSVTIETFNNGLKELDELVANSFSKIEELQTLNKGQQAAIDALKAPFANLPFSVNLSSQLKPLQDVIDANNKTIEQLKAAINEVETVSRPKLLADRKAFLDQIAANKERQRKLDEMKKNAEKPNGSSGSSGSTGGGSTGAPGSTTTTGLQWWAWLLIGIAVLVVLVIVFTLIARSMKKKTDELNNQFYEDNSRVPPAFV